MQFEIVSALNKCCYENKGAYLAVILAGEVMSVLASLPVWKQWDYVTLCEALSLCYEEVNQTAVVMIQFKHKVRERCEQAM